MSQVYEGLKPLTEEPGGLRTAAGVQIEPTNSPLVAGDTKGEHWSPDVARAGLLQNLNEPTAIAAANGHRRVIAHQATAAEHFLALATTIRSSIAQDNKHVVLVTSSVRGEGKSFVALNLAASLARISMPTVLIDADLRVPSKYHGPNSPPPNGLLTYLEGRTGFADCVYQTSIPGLSIVPSGGMSRAPLQTFLSARMNEFIVSVRERLQDHCVLIDSPPGPSVPEVRVFRTLVDAVLIVVAANRTPRTAVAKTLELVKDIPTLGLVLNFYKPSRSAGSYYSYDRSPRRNGRK